MLRIQTSEVSSMNVILVLIPNGQSMWILSLFNCNKNTINTNNELNMKNAKTDLLRSSTRSFATRSCARNNEIWKEKRTD